MAEKMIENNRVSVIGEIVSEFSFSHEVFGEGFYMVDLSVNRLSEQADVIPLEAVGQFRSYNRHEGVKNRLMLSVFAREIRFLDEFTDYTRTNQIFLDGYICKPPIYRKTPLGREIADLLLAVNRPYGSSARQSVKRGWHTRFLSASWNAARSRINKFSYDFLTENIRNICIISYIVLECVL